LVAQRTDQSLTLIRGKKYFKNAHSQILKNRSIKYGGGSLVIL